MNADLVLTLLIQSITHAQELATLFQKAKSENRDVTDAEVQSLSDGARAALDRLKAELGSK